MARRDGENPFSTLERNTPSVANARYLNEIVRTAPSASASGDDIVLWNTEYRDALNDFKSSVRGTVTDAQLNDERYLVDLAKRLGGNA